MDLLQTFTDVNFWMQVIQNFQNLGPIGPILLAASESIFSFLPFIAIVAFHVGIYGEVLGFLYSWIGTVAGSAIVFLTIRFCMQHLPFLRRLKAVDKLRSLLAQENQTALFFMTACAFMPSFLINVSYGMSDFDEKVFLKTILLSKSIMVATLVLFGSSMKNAMNHPVFLLASIFIFLLLYMLSKTLKKKLHGADK